MIKITKQISDSEIIDLILNSELSWCHDSTNVNKFCLQIFINEDYCVVLYFSDNRKFSINSLINHKQLDIFKFNGNITNYLYDVKKETSNMFDKSLSYFLYYRLNDVANLVNCLFKTSNLRVFK